MPDTLLLIALAVLPFAGAVAAGLLPTHARNAASGLAGAVALACLGLVWAAYPTVSAGGVLRAEFGWMPMLGLNLTLRMDGFAWLFAGLVTGIGTLVVLYARYYMSSDDPVPRFFAFLLAFMGAMTGLVISGNLVQLAFFWELTSLFSFLLIGYWHHTAAARDGARMALIITATGGLALFAGVLVLGHIVGSYELDAVLAAGDRIRGHPALPAGADPRPARRADEERAGPVPLLAAARDGRTHAGLGLSPLGHAREGGHLPDGAAVAGDGGYRGLVPDRGHGRSRHAAARGLRCDLPERPEGPAGLLDHQPSRPDHAASRPEQRAGPGRGRVPRPEPRGLQGLPVHGRRHHRPRDRHA